MIQDFHSSLEVEHPEHELVSIWDASSTSRDLDLYTTMLALRDNSTTLCVYLYSEGEKQHFLLCTVMKVQVWYWEHETFCYFIQELATKLLSKWSGTPLDSPKRENVFIYSQENNEKIFWETEWNIGWLTTIKKIKWNDLDTDRNTSFKGSNIWRTNTNSCCFCHTLPAVQLGQTGMTRVGNSSSVPALMLPAP